MPTSTERARDQQPPALPARRRVSALTLAGVAILLAALLGGSLFWLFSNRGGAAGKGAAKATVTAKATTVPTWAPTEVTPPAESFFYDTFDNNSHGWSLSGTDGLFRILVNNTLILADT